MRHLVIFSTLLSAIAALPSVWAGVSQPVTNPRSIDGTGNNLAHMSWGATETQMQRIAETPFSSGAFYPDDGSGSTFYGGPSSSAVVPNAREISNLLYDDQGYSKPSRRRLSHMVWQWGQFLDHDITLTETSSSASEFAPIDVFGDDPLSPSIPFARSKIVGGTGTSAANPRQQINSITSYIDASNVYGSDRVRAAAVRDIGNHGRLKTGTGDLLPFNVLGLPNAGGTSPSMFLGGDVRANEQVGLTAMHTLFMREHNRLADQLAINNPTWDDEQLYQTSRKIVGAEMQAITYREFLPALLGRRHARSLSPNIFSYDESINATIGNEFATSIYRFGHSMLPEELPLARVGPAPASSLPMAGAFFDPSFIGSDATGGTNHIEQVLLGLSINKAQEVDTKMTDAVRNFLFGQPGAGGMDLAALNIQRSRDHGMPLYNEMRIAYGLSPATSFRDITKNRTVRRQLRQLYDSVDEVDSWVGALAEEHVRGSSVGELALESIVEEFTKLRDGDRFFFTGDDELMDNPAIDAVVDLASVTLSDLMELNTDLVNVPRNVFRVSRWNFDLPWDRLNDRWHRMNDFFDDISDRFPWTSTMSGLNGLNSFAIPEPSTLLLGALAGIVGLLRRRSKIA